ncbi:TPA: hypothetical protein ACOAU0_000385 [Enterococcus faecium]|uniref:hypothetical protein n=1 Tax=Enterococcus TaxID=1350 RepID=UPI0004E03780|nr:MULTISPECIES: hypothetical protein [Enterococcus]AII40230.1 hypothetical protein M395_01870 [Enterococcus faecium T110]GEA73244.1 hypothetical protein ESP02_16140 [Enterococcus sp. NBRC 3427]MDO2410559.1 hypothetical protein [Enterococcus faecium]PEH47444.1 hypothetical protein CRM75_05760 [Enterococcus faecium]PHL15659.1 hypothetical protein CQR38_06585 [Enterococcus faecium]
MILGHKALITIIIESLILVAEVASGMLFHEMSILIVVINDMCLLTYRTKRKILIQINYLS